ncbi:MAG: polysaccharide biosynthesis protein [Clostridia bacterium]|nr:polysaccharide biosynthesis protein [Clostridia bacterium]
MKKSKTQTFMASVAMVMCSQIVIKLLGFMYRIVITNIQGFGDEGNGIYSYGYQIYVLLLAISSVGIPNAIAKLVSEKCATDDFKSAYRIFRCALILFAIIGALLGVGLYLAAPLIDSAMFDTPTIVNVLRVLSPAILFVSVSSVIRGFFQGMKNMKATSTSQVIEQLIKCVSTILIVVAIAGNSPEVMATGATVATTLSTFLSLLYVIWFYKANKADIRERLSDSKPLVRESFSKIAKSILYVAVPISLGSIVASINRVVDLTTVVQGLKVALSGTPNLDNVTMALSGMLSKGDVIINLPLALNIAFSTVLVPTVAGAMAIGDKKTACDKVSFSLLVSIVIALPATVGCMVLADEIFLMLYPNAPEGGYLFAISAITIFFSAITQTNAGSLQGLGKVFVPAIALVVGGVVKLIVNLVLIPIPEINILGAPIGSVLCQAIGCIITFSVVKKNLPMKLSAVKYAIKPLAAALIMGAVVFLVSRGLTGFVGNTLSTILAIGAGVIVYAVMVLIVFGIFNEDELKQLPGGRSLNGLISRVKKG